MLKTHCCIHGATETGMLTGAAAQPQAVRPRRQEMKKYTKADVSEQELEDSVRRNAGLIEEGLIYVDHQKPAAGGRLDVLLVDSGKSLVVAELKVT